MTGREEPRLTFREREIVSSLVVGATAQEIANELNVSFHTVRAHIRNVYLKLGIANRIELVHWQMRRDRNNGHSDA